MRSSVLLILCLLAWGCSSEIEQTAESSPISTTTTADSQNPTVLELECQDISGILGTVNISFNSSTVLHFYDRPDSWRTPAQTLRFYEDKELSMDSFRAEGERSYFELDPKRHKLDYSLFDLAVKTRQTGALVSWLEVVVGEDKHETLWLKESRSVKFRDWFQGMKESFAVGRIRSITNPLRIEPDPNAEEVPFWGHDCFKVKDMKGDWIQVELQTHCSEGSEQSVSGWIRWRDENGCLVVSIFAFA